MINGKKKAAALIAIVAVAVAAIFCLFRPSSQSEGKETAKGAGEVKEIDSIKETDEAPIRIELSGGYKVARQVSKAKALDDTEDLDNLFAGRSITIEPNRIITSYGIWPNDYYVERYNTAEEIRESDRIKEELQNRFDEDGLTQYAEQKIAGITYKYDDTEVRTFYVTENGDILCGDSSGLYLLEPYREVKTDLAEEQLYGAWEVKRLVSNGKGWLPYRSKHTDYPEELFGHTIVISAGEVTEAVPGEDRVCAKDEVSGYQSVITDMYDYQNEKIICDELGIASGYIQVFTAKRAEASEEDWWDGDIIVLDETHIIMKLYQGWFLLERV